MGSDGERKIGLAMDFSKGSKAALKWAIDELLREGDTLILINVKTRQAMESRNLLWFNDGSPLIPLVEIKDPEVMHGYGIRFDSEVLDLLHFASNQLQVTVLGKVYWGDAREKVCEAIADLHLDLLVMGSRGLGSIQRVLLGSVTSYVLQNVRCPVSVVKE